MAQCAMQSPTLCHEGKCCSTSRIAVASATAQPPQHKDKMPWLHNTATYAKAQLATLRHEAAA